MKQKIAILTQPLGHNFGGIIQNYALQKVLTDLGHQTITINRRWDNPHSKIKILISKYRNIFFRKVLKSKNPVYLDYEKAYINNNKFLDKYINLSSPFESSELLKEYFENEKFNTVVVGSDQVWRPKYSPNIFNYFLDFLEDNKNIQSLKKIAYAASFGTEEWEYNQKQTQKCQVLLNNFDAVSVREDSAVKLCSKYLKRNDAVHVIDPTLLLDEEDYSELINQPKKSLGLFTYVLDDSIEKIEFVENCANELKLERSTNQAKYKTNTFKSSDINDYLIPPIENWLRGFRDSEFVVTDSFHGTVFSIINNKPFLSLVNKERGASRFESLLDELGLGNRLIYNVNDFDTSLLKQKIDYETVKRKLENLKLSSLNFIKENI